MGKELRVIRASEIGEYNYCSRAWWYKHVLKLSPPAGGEQPGRFVQGRQAHAQHGRSIAMSGALRTMGLGLLICGLLVLTMVFLLNTLGR